MSTEPSDGSDTVSEEASEEVSEDFAIVPVPLAARRPMWEVVFIRLGAFACVPQLLLGASLGYGLTFREAVWATLLGSIILQVLSWALGAAACAEGLSTTLLACWAGFGRVGSAIVGAVIAVALTGWFGVQNGVFANGMFQATGVLNVPLWAIVTGVAVTWITVEGYKLISLIAKIALPLFLLAVGWAAFHLTAGHTFGELVQALPAGPRLSVPQAITAVTGSFVIGAIVTPDVSRFMRSRRDVFWMTLIATFVGELTINLLAVAMALLLRTADIVVLMASLAGGIGAAIAVISTIKLNNLNLYSSSLGFSTLIRALKPKASLGLSRTRITWLIGIISTLISTFGLLNHFIGFLVFLGVVIPPVAGIMVVDYYVLKRDRDVLAEARARGQLPTDPERINPVAMASWVAACITALQLPQSFGIPALNALVLCSALYWIGMRAVAWQRNVPVARF